MLTGQDLDLVPADAVDHTIALHEDLTDVVELVLGNDAPTLWEEG